MHILVTGGTGFIGGALLPELVSRGHCMTVLTRGKYSDSASIRYVNDLDAIEGRVDAVINLAGAGLAARRWSKGYKREIVDSRIGLTQHLVSWLERQQSRPGLLISGSAVGFYGQSLTDVFTEESGPGKGFSAELCRQWEVAAQTAESFIPQVVLLRLGVVLDHGGGALREMLKSFQLGIGSWLGSGNQWLSWVHRRDVVNAICFVLETPGIQGPINLTAPKPVTHGELCGVAKEFKWTFFSAGMPSSVVRLLMGEMADELLLNGQRVEPQRLQQLDFVFEYSDLRDALANILGR